MDIDKLVDDYISAWNLRDADGLLALLHAGFAIYNAFWMESSVGRDAATYLRGLLQEERYCYRREGVLIPFNNGVVFRYTAHELTDSALSQSVFNGAEVLTLRDDKIITISDFYCDPNENALLEVAKLTMLRHGQTRYVKSALHAVN